MHFAVLAFSDDGEEDLEEDPDIDEDLDLDLDEELDLDLDLDDILILEYKRLAVLLRLVKRRFTMTIYESRIILHSKRVAFASYGPTPL